MKRILIPAAAVIIGTAAFAHSSSESHTCCRHDHQMGNIEYGNRNAYKRYCPYHGWYDIRFGATCPGCRAPQFGF